MPRGMGDTQVLACVSLFLRAHHASGVAGSRDLEDRAESGGMAAVLTAMPGAVLASLPTRRDDGRMNGRLA